MLRDAKEDFWKGGFFSFYAPYNRLSLQGSNPGTFLIAQVMNEYLGTDYNAVYITKPKKYDSDRTYPVIFFAHGYLGSWELYQGLFSQLDDFFVVSIGTRDMSGIFSYNDINKVFMKSGREVIALRDKLAERGQLEGASMVANCGLLDEKVFPHLADVTEEDADYFSIVLVKGA